MFTGIIETIGKVVAAEEQGANRRLTIESSISKELKIDQSVSHNGVCLTVVDVSGDTHAVIAVKETLSRTNLGTLTTGAHLNLERAMPANGRFDGHFVQGHVDQTGTCLDVIDENGSRKFWFSFSAGSDFLIVEKGSICIDGVSLTVVDALADKFSVVIIPYTLQHTGFKFLEKGATVNLEFDVLGKYVMKGMQMRGVAAHRIQ